MIQSEINVTKGQMPVGADGTIAETLRQSNFTGEITVLTNESLLPYDRTLLSKCFGGGGLVSHV